MFSQKFIFIFIFEYPLRIISELIKIQVDISKLIKYYTDFHDVDEDIDTIPSQGGNWDWTNGAGAYLRQPDNPLDITYVSVALIKHRALPMKECPMRMLSYNFKVR